MINGKIYTINHRRLVAYDLADRATIPAKWATEEEIFDNIYEFTTENGGIEIEIRGGVTYQNVRRYNTGDPAE